jgi:hypothetical protein
VVIDLGQALAPCGEPIASAAARSAPPVRVQARLEQSGDPEFASGSAEPAEYLARLGRQNVLPGDHVSRLSHQETELAVGSPDFRRRLFCPPVRSRPAVSRAKQPDMVSEPQGQSARGGRSASGSVNQSRAKVAGR